MLLIYCILSAFFICFQLEMMPKSRVPDHYKLRYMIRISREHTVHLLRQFQVS